jgi:hypothetical protein
MGVVRPGRQSINPRDPKKRKEKIEKTNLLSDAVPSLT